MELMRWEPPFKGIERLSDTLNRFLARPLNLFERPLGMEESLTITEWTPAVDIEESDKEYLVKAEIPEVKKENVKVLVEDGSLVIQGERRKEKEEKGVKFHRTERSYGSFLRSFTLPVDADEKKIAAEFEEGLLKVHLPKTEAAKPKAVEIKVTGK